MEKKLKQMSLLEDSLVKVSPLQEKEEAQEMIAISGQKCFELLPKSNQAGWFGRMCKELLTSKTAWYSDRCKMTWKKKVSKADVLLFQLAVSVHGTKEKGSGESLSTKTTGLIHTPTAKANQVSPSMVNRDKGSWGNHMYATPNTMDHLPPRSKEGTLKLQQGHRKGRTLPPNLREQVDPQTMAMYPTPTTQEIEHPDMVLNERGRRMPKKGKTDHSLNLADTVRMMYPTPNAWDGMRGPRSEKHIRENPNSQITLVTKVAQIERKKMYPTPNTNDGATNPAEDIENWEKRAEKKKKEGINLHYALRHAVQKEEQMKMYPTPRTGAGSRPNGKGGKVLEEEVMIEAGLRERGKTLKQMYPTPVAKDNCSESLESWEKRAEKHKEQGKTIPKALRIKVQEEAEMFPTPTARDYKDMGYKPSWKPSRDKSLPREVLKSNTHGGRLNVNFVEFLMGFPTNYSEIESVE
jgi:hypothetical protein